eukprot:2768516-Rhodomonas_salina.2
MPVAGPGPDDDVPIQVGVCRPGHGPVGSDVSSCQWCGSLSVNCLAIVADLVWLSVSLSVPVMPGLRSRSCPACFDLLNGTSR